MIEPVMQVHKDMIFYTIVKGFSLKMTCLILRFWSVNSDLIKGRFLGLVIFKDKKHQTLLLKYVV